MATGKKINIIDDPAIIENQNKIAEEPLIQITKTPNETQIKKSYFIWGLVLIYAFQMLMVCIFSAVFPAWNSNYKVYEFFLSLVMITAIVSEWIILK